MGTRLAIAFGATAFAAFTARAADVTEELKAKVHSAFATRAKATDSLRVKYTETKKYYKGTFSRMFPPEMNKIPIAPPTDVSHVNEGTLWFDGRRIRCECNEHIWSTNRSEFDRNAKVLAFDGETLTDWWSSDAQTFPSARYSKPAAILEGPLTPLWPIRFMCRGLDEKVMGSEALTAYPELSSRVKGKDTLIECLKGKDERRGEFRVMLDPAKQYAVKSREQYSAKNQPISKWTVSKYRDVEGVTLPVEWMSEFFSAGQYSFTSHVVVEEVELASKLPESSYSPVPPVGSLVSDQRVNPPKSYILREDNRERTIAPGELTKGYDVLVATEPTERERPVLSGTVIYSAGAFVAVALAVVVIRKLMRNARR